MELVALQSEYEAIQATGASLIAISPQRAERNADVVNKHNLKFPVLSDPGNSYAASLGLVFTLPEDLQAVYRGFGIDLPTDNGDDSWTLPLPARLIVDAKGIVQAVDADPDYTIRPDPSASLAVVSGLAKKPEEA